MNANDTAVQEHRGLQRIEVSEVIKAVDRQTGKTVGQLVNISEDGLMLLSPGPVPENSIFQLSLEFAASSTSAADGPVLIGVESLWNSSSSDQSQHWVGFCIIDISVQNLERIRKLAK